MSASPHANGGQLLRGLDLPDFSTYAVPVVEPATESAEATTVLGAFLRDVIARNLDRFRIMGPNETASNHQSRPHARAGFKERGTTTTPFDMVMLNDHDRFHLVIDVIDRVEGLANRAAELRQRMVDARLDARRYAREHGEDDPQIVNWTWDSARLDGAG